MLHTCHLVWIEVYWWIHVHTLYTPGLGKIDTNMCPPRSQHQTHSLWPAVQLLPPMLSPSLTSLTPVFLCSWFWRHTTPATMAGAWDPTGCDSWPWDPQAPVAGTSGNMDPTAPNLTTVAGTQSTHTGPLCSWNSAIRHRAQPITECPWFTPDQPIYTPLCLHPLCSSLLPFPCTLLHQRAQSSQPYPATWTLRSPSVPLPNFQLPIVFW